MECRGAQSVVVGEADEHERRGAEFAAGQEYALDWAEQSKIPLVGQ